jgi:hypothetical protein
MPAITLWPRAVASVRPEVEAVVVIADTRIRAVRRYLKQLDATIDRSHLTADDQEKAPQEDRQGLGLSRRHVEAKALWS